MFAEFNRFCLHVFETILIDGQKKTNVKLFKIEKKTQKKKQKQKQKYEKSISFNCFKKSNVSNVN